MVDLSEPLRDLDRLREFLARWDATARPPTGPFELAGQWLAKAGLAHEWPELKTVLAGARSDGELIANSARLTQRLRESKSGFGFKLFGPSPPSPAEIAATLENLCLALAPDATSLTGRLSESMAAELRSQPVALLLQLLRDTGWAELPPTVWGDSEWETPLANPGAREFLEALESEAKLSPERAAAALVAWRLGAIWAGRVRGAEAWMGLESWLRLWFDRAGLSGELRLRPGDESNPFGCRVHYQCREPFSNPVLSLGAPVAPAHRFETEPQAAPPPTSAWSGLPKPPTCRNIAPVPLLAWFDACERAVEKRRMPPAETDAKAQFDGWIREAAGADWLDASLRLASTHPDGGEAAWWRVLRERGWCEIHPDLDRGGIRPNWPEAMTRIDDRPAGTPLEVPRYSADPKAARVVLSEGPAPADSALARFHELFKSEPDNEGLWGEGRWSRARGISVGDIPDESAVELADVWQAVAVEAPPGGSLIAAWLRCFGIGIIDPSTAPAEEVELSSRFHPSPVGASIGPGRWGYRRHDAILKRAIRNLSAGPAPAGFDALQLAVQHWPADHPYRAGVAKLPDAIGGGYLLESALELFTDYWDQAHANRGESGRLYGEELGRFLHSALKLETFAPRNWHDHREGWVTPSSGSRLVTGVVRRLFRPGVVDDRGELRIPALAEID